MCHLSAKPECDGFWSTDYYRSMASNLWLLREQNLYCDLEIECEDKVINVHRVIVSAGLSYFGNLLSSNMAESLNKKVKLSFVTYEALRQILSFVYTGQIHLDKNNIEEVTRAADFLLVEPVKQICEAFLLANIDVSNCLTFKQLSYDIVSDKLGTIDEFVLRNFEHLCTDPNIGVYEFNEFQQLLQDDNLGVRHEIQVFQSIVRWVDFDPDARLELLGSLITNVRFLFMSTEEIQLVVKHPFMARSAHATKLIAEVQEHIKQNGQTQFNNLHSTIRSAIEAKTRPTDSRFLPLNRFCASGTLICLGGRHESSNPCDFVETYNPHSNEWRYKHELLPFAGRQVGITVIGFNVFVLGGYDARGQPLSSGILNSQTGNYEPIQQMPLARRGCAVTHFEDEYVFALGGSDSGKYAAFADVQRFDVEKQEWTFVEPMLTGRRNLAAVTVGNYIYAIGGCFGEESFCVSSMERFNVRENCWEPLEDMKFGRYSCGAAVLGQRIYIVGGFGWDFNKSQFTPLDSCEYYDTNTETWHSVESLQTGRGAASLVEMDGHLYAIGGFNGEYLSSVERYDPILDKWTYCAPIQQGRSGAGCAHIKAFPNEVFCKFS